MIPTKNRFVLINTVLIKIHLLTVKIPIDQFLHGENISTVHQTNFYIEKYFTCTPATGNITRPIGAFVLTFRGTLQAVEARLATYTTVPIGTEVKQNVQKQITKL